MEKNENVLVPQHHIRHNIRKWYALFKPGVYPDNHHRVKYLTYSSMYNYLGCSNCQK